VPTFGLECDRFLSDIHAMKMVCVVFYLMALDTISQLRRICRVALVLTL
jgi:hypothetical protein